MDVQLPATKSRRVRRNVQVGAVVLALAVLTVVAAQLAGRPPSISGDELWTARVTHGEFVHEIAGTGTLVAPEIRSITNRSDGLVERVAVLPGHPVEPNDVLVELSSPQLAYDLEDALWEFESAEAEEQLRRAQAADRLLDLRASVAIAEAEYTTANLESEVKTALGESQIVSALEIQQAQIRAEQLLERLQAERAKLERYPETRAAEDAAAEAGLAQKRQRVRRLEEQVGDLNVRAGVTGIVQEVNVEVGERVAAGTDIARIVNPELLIARVRISERDVASVLVGQAVRLELGRDTIAGRVSRIDPTVRERFVTLDIDLIDRPKTPPRPDTTVTARIELARVADALLVDRPVQLRDDATDVSVFRLAGDGNSAERVSIEVGRISSRQVEILNGLEPGDEIILSDVGDWSDEPVVRIR